MLRLKEDDSLTVYNGVEERGTFKSFDGSRPVPEMCCGDGDGDPDESCQFKDNCNAEIKRLHGKLILGEQLNPADLLEDKAISQPIVDLFNDWNLNGLNYALEVAKQEWTKIRAKVPTMELLKAEKNPEDLFIAVALVKTFVQLNYTGPDVTNDEVKEKLEAFSSPSGSGSDAEVLLESLQNCIEIDGCERDGILRCPELLFAAKYFLSSIEGDKSVWPFYLIWRFRIEFLHQRMLLRRSWTLSRNLKCFADKYISWLGKSNHELDGIMKDVNATFLCEISQMLVFYYDGILSERFLAEAKKSLELAVTFSGKMGFRTQFQQTPTPQTVINVQLNADRDHRDCSDVSFSSLSGTVPRSEALNDDTRLERIKLVDEEDLQSHRGIHQLVILGIMLQKRKLYENELDRQESEALIRAVVDHPLTWCGRMSVLMERCILEKLDRRAIDRALRQLEELWKITSRPDDTTHSLYRQHLFFGSGHPTKSEIKVLLGQMLLSLEHWKEALAIYTELGSFDKIIHCYEMINLRHKAEELVREKINEKGETPKLLVLLGDVTSDISNYEKAWTLSSEKSFESQIRLGNYYFKRKEYKESVKYFKRVVDLVPLEYPCWIKLAWACYQTEDYETAFQAYLYAANLEYDNFQVWNNLANSALKLNRKDYALRAYKEAVKCNYDEWRVWSNILSVATELNAVNDSILAYHRILDLNKNFSDEVVLDQVVRAVVTATRPSIIMINALAKLFGRITAMGTRSPHTWLLYGRLLASYIDFDTEDGNNEVKVQHFERSMQYYDKALTIMRQDPTWRSDLFLLRNIVSCISEFRMQRLRWDEKMRTEPTQVLKNKDEMLRQTASSVHEMVTKLLVDAPLNVRLRDIVTDMSLEIQEPFYA